MKAIHKGLVLMLFVFISVVFYILGFINGSNKEQERDLFTSKDIEHVIDYRLSIEEDSVVIIQSWQGNTTRCYMSQLEETLIKNNL
jgi:hypothetical protein